MSDDIIDVADSNDAHLAFVPAIPPTPPVMSFGDSVIEIDGGGRYGGTGAVVEYDVKVKADPDSPELPMPGALVRLYGRERGELAWQGLSDAQGKYTARGLQYGREYIPMAVDLTRTYEAVAAGPIIAGVDPVAPGETPEPPQIDHAAVLPSKITVSIGVPFWHGVFFKADGPLQSIAAETPLPAALQFSGSAIYSDWPTGEPGSYTITYQIGDIEGTHELKQEVALILLPLEIAAVPEILSYLVLDEPMGPITFVASGGEGPYTFGYTGDLPDGTQFTDNEDGTATWDGKPDTKDIFNFDVIATDTRSTQASTSVNVLIMGGFVDRFLGDTLGPAWITKHYDGTGGVSVVGGAVRVSANNTGDFWASSDGASLIGVDLPEGDDVLIEVTVKTTSIPEWTRLVQLRADVESSASAFVCLHLTDTGRLAPVYRDSASSVAAYTDVGPSYNSGAELDVRVGYDGSRVTAWVSQDKRATWTKAWAHDLSGLKYACLSCNQQAGYVEYSNFMMLQP